MKLTPALARMLAAVGDDNYSQIFRTKQSPRLLRSLRERGLVQWSTEHLSRSGYELTDQGRAAL